VIAAFLYNLNYWYVIFLFNEFDHFIEVRVALMLLLIPDTILVDLVDIFVIGTMFF
jgi:hypothetical protein